MNNWNEFDIYMQLLCELTKESSSSSSAEATKPPMNWSPLPPRALSSALCPHLKPLQYWIGSNTPNRECFLVPLCFYSFCSSAWNAHALFSTADSLWCGLVIISYRILFWHSTLVWSRWPLVCLYLSLWQCRSIAFEPLQRRCLIQHLI